MTDFLNAQPDLVVSTEQPQYVLDQTEFDDGAAGADTTNLTQLASWCAEAALLAVHSDPASDASEVRQDAAALLTALSHMLARPLTTGRLPVLRATMEAGIRVTTDCAAECRSMGDDEATSALAAVCERCAGELRDALDDLETSVTD